MRLKFSKKVTIICTLLAAAMLRMSYWQWQRHIEKQGYISAMQSNLEMPIEDLAAVLKSTESSQQLFYRRVRVKGQFDFEHEMLLRNRKLDNNPGVFLLTPLKLDDSPQYVLISRGFIPLSYSLSDKRKIFQREKTVSFTGIIKEPLTRKFMAPADPPAGGTNPWVDAWLRVDTAAIGKQLPYQLKPFYIEVMPEQDSKLAQEKIVSAKSEREEMMFMAGKTAVAMPKKILEEELVNYPIAVFDTVIPPARHLGYVFEWAIMAVITLLMGLVLQFRRTA